jgi:two-component system response regulator PilR (NtrC family)
MTRQSALVIDDEPDIRELLVLTLSRMGLVVDTAATLGEAFARLNEHEYDLCLTDMRLPDGNGQDIVAHVVKQQATDADCDDHRLRQRRCGRQCAQGGGL